MRIVSGLFVTILNSLLSGAEFITWDELLEGWLAPTNVKYHDNLWILMLFNQWLTLNMLRATGPWSLC